MPHLCARKESVSLLPVHSLAFFARLHTAPCFRPVNLLPLLVLHDATRFYAFLNLPRHALQIDHVVRNEHVL